MSQTYQRKSTDLTPSDQERLQRIVDHAAQSGIELDFPKAIRVAMSAWEAANLPKPVTAAAPSADQDPEANERWQQREIDKQQNPED